VCDECIGGTVGCVLKISHTLSNLCLPCRERLKSPENRGERKKGAKAVPGCSTTSVSHMGETVTGNSLMQQLQGEMIKE